MNGKCQDCGFELWIPIADLRCSSIGLYDDARFPGRCLVMFHEHVEAQEELEGSILESWMLDLKTASSVIKKVTGAPRINLAILGNAEPHLHAHLIPRMPGGDPIPTRSPWDHPLPVTPLHPTEVTHLVTELCKRLGSSQRRGEGMRIGS